MPKRVQARAAQNEQEEREVRKLARSHHAPSDWKLHAQMIIQSWAGKSPQGIATELKIHPKTVRTHLARFNREGISGLGMRSGSGRKPRLTELERSRILALVKLPPPGRLERRADEMVARDEQGAAQWTLDAQSAAARRRGGSMERGCVRDGKEITRCAASRNSKGYIALITDVEAANPTGDIYVISDNLSSHNSAATRAWLLEHPRIQHVFIPKRSCCLNLKVGR